MTKLEREIRKFNILAHMDVRGGGSMHKGYPDKNLWDICGKSCIQWAIEAARGSKYIDKVTVLTESEEIKKVVRGIKGVTLIDRPLWTALNVPRDFTQGTFQRNKPRSIQSGEALIFNDTITYVQYYLEETEGFTPEIILYFSAGEPLITSQTYDRLIEKFFETEIVGIVFPVYRTPMQGLFIIDEKTERPFGVFTANVSRQRCFPLWRDTGPILRGSPSKLQNDSLIGETVTIEVSPEEGADIHSPEDLFIAQCYMKRRLLKEGKEVKWSIGDKQKNKKGDSDV